MKAKGKRQKAKEVVNPQPAIRNRQSTEAGFSLTELLIAMMVFTIIMGSVVVLLTKSQRIFTTEQNAAETNQNGRMLIDFLTRDVQQSKENALGLGDRFRSVYSVDGTDGKTDELTIISSDTDTKVPSKALPLMAVSEHPFNAKNGFVEMMPNGAGRMEAAAIVNTFKSDEEFIISSVLKDGSIQFDFIKMQSAEVTNTGTLAIKFVPVEHKGIQPEIPLGSDYEGGGYTMRPVAIKRYYIDRKTDSEHPTLALSVNSGEAITIARNVTAFQLRYLEVREGETEAQWVKQQSISSKYRTQAIEVTMTAKSEIADKNSKEPQMTLATVIRPRQVPSGAFGSSNGSTSPGIPGGDGSGVGGNGDGSGGNGDGIGDGNGGGTGFGNGRNGTGFGNGLGDGSGDDGGFDRGGYRHETRRIGKQPKLGERLNPR
jgi:prepilin-type N-terminal cleavage/methylation domain-containing protein